MDLSFVEAPPQTVENHHTSNDTNNTIDFDEALENMLSLDLSDFDFSLFDVTLPSQLLPPVTGEMQVDPIPAPVVPPQLPSFSKAPDNVNLVEINSALAACRGNGGGKRVLEPHRNRNRNRVCLGGGSSAPLSLKKRTVLPPEKLAELEIVDPRRAKRIINNRNAAKRSKEKKRNYEKELEKRVELLRIKADNVTAERLMAMNETMQLAAEYNRVKDLIQSKLEHQARQRAFIEAMKEEAKILTMQIHELNTAMADPSFGKPGSQSQLQLPHQPELNIPPPPQQPLVPPPTSSFGEPFVPPYPSPFGEPFVPFPPSSFGNPLVPSMPSPFGQMLVPPPISSFGEPLVPPPSSSLFGEPLVPPPSSSLFGEPLVPPPPSSFGNPLVPPMQSSFGEPLVPPPISPFGEPLLPPPVSSFGEPLLPPPVSSFGEPRVPPLSPFGEPLLPPPASSFGEPLVPPLISPFVEPLLPPAASSFGKSRVPSISPFGEPLLPPPASSFGEPRVPPISSFGEPLLPPLASSFGEPLVPPQASPFGEPFSEHFIGTSFSNYNPWD